MFIIYIKVGFVRLDFIFRKRENAVTVKRFPPTESSIPLDSRLSTNNGALSPWVIKVDSQKRDLYAYRGIVYS